MSDGRWQLTSIEGPIAPFLDERRFDVQPLVSGERFPNVVLATDGSVVATTGKQRIEVRRSADGGASWEPATTVAEPGIHGGGVVVDELSGDIVLFVEDGHPPAPLTVYRSTDHGRTWREQPVHMDADVRGNVPSMHMCEHGITLRHGSRAGRLLRPARVYGERPRGYNTAIYSDDHGHTWHPSAPFPDIGTGEGAVAELSNGRIYYSSRKHWFETEAPAAFHAHRHFAWSDDGGETWRDMGVSQTLPDGPRYRGAERRGANYNAHFGMMGGLVRLPVAQRDVLLYSNADTSDHQRIRLTAWASFDGGMTWPIKRLVHDGPSAYSSLAAGRPGTPSEGWIYLLYEGGAEHMYDGLHMGRFNLTWLLEGDPTGDGEVPGWLTP